VFDALFCVPPHTNRRSEEEEEEEEEETTTNAKTKNLPMFNTNAIGEQPAGTYEKARNIREFL